MFSKLPLVTVLSACVTSSLAGPLWRQSPAKRTSGISFSGWRGISSLDGFDNFYGVDDFSGTQTSVVVVEQEEEVVCQSVSIEIIQQQLTVIREYVKRIITQQICEVETQTIVFAQFESGISSFGSDIQHISGSSPSYDSHIASMIGSIHDSSGAPSTTDLGFSGSDVGSQSVSPSGSNWNSNSSPASVSAAYSAAQAAASSSGGSGSLPNLTSASSSGSSSSSDDSSSSDPNSADD